VILHTLGSLFRDPLLIILNSHIPEILSDLLLPFTIAVASFKTLFQQSYSPHPSPLLHNMASSNSSDSSISPSESTLPIAGQVFTIVDRVRAESGAFIFFFFQFFIHLFFPELPVHCWHGDHSLIAACLSGLECCCAHPRTGSAPCGSCDGLETWSGEPLLPSAGMPFYLPLRESLFYRS
jgi:hypothetical protein